MEDFFKKETKIFSACLERLYDMLEWVRERISKYFSQSDMNRIELVIEEVFVNIMNHAYKKKKGDIHLSLEINNHLEIVIQDKGPFFNPLLVKNSIDDKHTLHTRETGGLGLIFIKEYMDEIEYHRKEPYNILILRKRIKK